MAQVWPLSPCNTAHPSLGTSLLSGTARCPRFTLYFLHPSSGVSQFSKKPRFLGVRMILKTKTWTIDVLVVPGILLLPDLLSRELGHQCVCACACAHTHLYLFLYLSTYIYVYIGKQLVHTDAPIRHRGFTPALSVFVMSLSKRGHPAPVTHNYFLTSSILGHIASEPLTPAPVKDWPISRSLMLVQSQQCLA